MVKFSAQLYLIFESYFLFSRTDNGIWWAIFSGSRMHNGGTGKY